MKRFNIVSKVLITLIAIIATSCIDHYKISTKVNKDGSIKRTISITGDSACWDEARIFVPTDNSWDTSMHWKYKKEGDTTSDKRYTLTASRTFKNVGTLKEFFKIESDTSNFVRIDVNLSKNFRWFYTFFKYTEKFNKSFPFNHYPIDNYLSDIEMGYFYTDDYTYVREFDSLVFIEDLEQMPLLSREDSNRMEALELVYTKKFAEWQARNVFEEYIQLIRLIDTNFVLTAKEKEALIAESQLIDGFQINLEDNETNSFDSIAKWFQLTEDSIKLLLPNETEVFYKKIELANSFWFVDNEINNQVELPGLLVNSNADSISASTSYWNYNENIFFTKDFNLKAESRVVNHWAFVLTGVITMLLLTLLIVGFVKK